MPRVVLDYPATPSLVADCSGGERLVDLCDERALPLPFSCRAATCGMCTVDIVAGAEWLEPPSNAEREALQEVGALPARSRLACQVRLRPGDGLIHLRSRA